MKKLNWWLMVGGGSLAVLAACEHQPSGVYFNRGDPEMLIDSSSEIVNMTLATSASFSELTSAVVKDPPTRAELNCQPSEALCGKAKKLFDQHGIPAKFAGGKGGVALVYNRVIARDCVQRYINNSSNNYNLNHPTFGCSVTGNTVQQVSDKREFVNPSLMDFPDGEKTVQAYRGYLKPSEKPASQDQDKSALSSISGGGTSSR